MSYGRNPDSASYGFNDSFRDSNPKRRQYDYGEDAGQPLYEDDSNNVGRDYEDTYTSKADTANESDVYDDPYSSSATQNPDRGSSANNATPKPSPSTGQSGDSLPNPYDNKLSNITNNRYTSGNADGGYHRGPDSHNKGSLPAHNKPNNLESAPIAYPDTSLTDKSTLDPYTSNDETDSSGTDSSNRTHSGRPAVLNDEDAAPASNPPASGQMSASDLYANFDNHKQSPKTQAGPNDSCEPGRPELPSAAPKIDATADQAASAGGGGADSDWLHKGVALVAQKAGCPVDDGMVDTIEGGLRKLGLDKLF